MRGKKYQAVKSQVPEEAQDLLSAINFLKSHCRDKFDETFEVHLNLNLDSSKSDQIVRGSVVLPSGSVRQQKVVVFTDDQAQADAALAAGASQAGGEDLINQINTDGSLAADVTVAVPSLMPKIARIAKILGPRGLMPNPKTGTVSDDPVRVVKELAGGKVSYKMDQQGNLHLGVGKCSWPAEKIVANVEAFLQSVQEAKPAGVKGQLIGSMVVKTTMSPAVKVVS